MKKPLMVDLYCGLLQTQLFRSANALVDQFMASGTQNPDHVRFSVFHLSPRPITCEFRPVRQFQNPTLTTRLTRLRKIGIFSSDPDDHSGILVWTAGIVNRKDFWVSLVKLIPAVFCALYSTILRAVSAVTIRWFYVEMSRANFTEPPAHCRSILFSPAKPSFSGLASERAIFFINPACDELGATRAAE